MIQLWQRLYKKLPTGVKQVGQGIIGEAIGNLRSTFAIQITDKTTCKCLKFFFEVKLVKINVGLQKNRPMIQAIICHLHVSNESLKE